MRQTRSYEACNFIPRIYRSSNGFARSMRALRSLRHNYFPEHQQDDDSHLHEGNAEEGYDNNTAVTDDAKTFRNSELSISGGSGFNDADARAILYRHGMIIDIEDIVRKEEEWWTKHATKHREQAALAGDTHNAIAEVCKLLLKHKGDLVHLFRKACTASVEGGQGG